MPLVTVIIPNYNHAPFLRQRIGSVINQTYQSIEVILLDDGSSDDSRSIIEEYRNHPKITHIIFNEVNTGSPFTQWQKGFELANGDYIWVAESDDYADSEFLRAVISTFQSNPSVGLVFTDSNVIDDQGKIHLDFYKKHRNRNFDTDKWNTNYVTNGLQEIKGSLFFDCTINNMSAAVFKKALLTNVNFAQLNSFAYCGDWYFLITLLMECDVAYIAKALNYFKSGTDNFRKGTKSVLNYHKERALVRYFFWQKLQKQFTEDEKNKVYADLGDGLKIQINEVLKGKSSFVGTVKMIKELRRLNSSLFDKQFKKALQKFW
jgi:glycosyltransferase involved in cell wall biosynthesis